MRSWMSMKRFQTSPKATGHNSAAAAAAAAAPAGAVFVSNIPVRAFAAGNSTQKGYPTA